MKRGSGSGGSVTVAIACAAAGIVAVALSLAVQSRDSGDTPMAATAEYGQRLVRDTARYLGPDHEDPAMRYSGTQMACASCHLDSGARPGTLSLLPAADRYPRESGRDGGVRDLRDRINGCMERSMNGLPLPRDSIEMIAIEAYIDSLGEQLALMSESRREPAEPPAFIEPDRAADPAAGQHVYEASCQVCHGADGEGLHASADPADGYLFPPLWGADSFNNGAGMNRVLTAARFIKARMPFGQPQLTDEQAFDVAAFINSKPRPEKADLEQDYPDLTTKPVDSPYPPYADPFPQAQHQFGPFQPIRDYYEAL